jgi:hypothetical protein
VITPVPTPPPVVITSQPTPVPSTTPCICLENPLAQTQVQAQVQAQAAFNAFNVLPIIIIGIGIIAIIVGAFSVPGTSNTKMSTSMSTTASSLQQMPSLPAKGIIGIVMAVGGVLIALYVMAIVVGSVSDIIMLATPNISQCICP